MQEPRSPLAGRFQFVKGLQASAKSISWLATDARNGSSVVIASIGTARLAGLQSAVGFRHRHVATVVKVIRGPRIDELPPGAPRVAGVAVAQLVNGRCLQDELHDGPLSRVEAVQCVLTLIAAVESLEAIGGLHGAISPRSIILRPEAPDREGPVLTQLLAAPSGPYCTPERLRGEGPSDADDAWALHATLFTALTGAAPFGGTSVKELIHAMVHVGAAPLDRFDIQDPTLQALVAHGLVADPAKRETRIANLAAALRRWIKTGGAAPSAAIRQPSERPPALAENADWDDDDARTIVVNSSALLEMAPPDAAPDRSSAPELLTRNDDEDAASIDSVSELLAAPLKPPVKEPERAPEPETNEPPLEQDPKAPRPPLQTPSAAVASGDWTTQTDGRVRPARRRRAVLVFALAGLSVLAGTGYVARARWMALLQKPPPAHTRRQVVQRRPPAPRPAPSAALPRQPSARARLTACVTAHFPKDALEPGSDFSFVCSDADLRDVCSKLREKFTPASDAAPTATGTALWAGFGWYQLPAAAILRGQCCAAPAPIQVPVSAAVCPQPARSLRDFAVKKLVPHQVLHDEVAFSVVATCFFVKHVANPFHFDKPPSDRDLATFKQFVHQAEQLSN